MIYEYIHLTICVHFQLFINSVRTLYALIYLHLSCRTQHNIL